MHVQHQKRIPPTITKNLTDDHERYIFLLTLQLMLIYLLSLQASSVHLLPLRIYALSERLSH